MTFVLLQLFPTHLPLFKQNNKNRTNKQANKNNNKKANFRLFFRPMKTTDCFYQYSYSYYSIKISPLLSCYGCLSEHDIFFFSFFCINSTKGYLYIYKWTSPLQSVYTCIYIYAYICIYIDACILRFFVGTTLYLFFFSLILVTNLCFM